MKLNKSLIWAFVLMVVVAALYRIIPGRPAGFAPQMALALFGGSMIKDKRWALALPVFSLFLSDLIFQLLYIGGLTQIQGLYGYQIPMYLCFMVITVFGFLLKKPNVLNVAAFGTAGSLFFFIVSNFFVWLGGFGFERPKTFEGLMLCYEDALAFYRQYGAIPGFAGNFIVGDLFFVALIFGGYFLVKKFLIGKSSAVQFVN